MSGRRMEVLAAVVAAAATFAVAAPAGAQAASSHPAMAKKAPAAQATISADSAQKIALAQVPHGRVREAEIEQDKGTLVYSYDIKASGKSGVEEVLVDAKTGAVVSKTHESAAAEAKEMAAEKKAAPAKKATHTASASTKPAKSTSAKSATTKPMANTGTTKP